MSVEVLSVRGLRPECGKVDRDLWLWFCEAKRDSENYHGPRVTKRLVQAKAKQAFQAAGIHNFKASDGWYIRWLKRWHRVGLENAAKQQNQGDPTKRSSGNSQLPKKSTAKRPKAKASKCQNYKGSTEERIISNFTESGPNYYSSIDNESFTIETSVAESPASLQQSVSGCAESNAFFFPSSASSVCPAAILHDSGSSDFSDALLAQEYNIQSEACVLEASNIGEPFPPDTSSLLNLDDFSWNDMSDLSSFGRILPSKVSVASAKDIITDNLSCATKSTSQFLKLCNKTNASKGKGKLIESQKLLSTHGLSSSQDSGSAILAKKLTYCPRKTNLITSVPVKNVANTSQDVSIKLNCRFGPEEKLANLHFSNKTVSHIVVKASKAGTRFERISDVADKGTLMNNLGFKEPISIGNRGNLSNHLISKGTAVGPNSEGYSDFNEDAVCGHFAQQDFEDVSVSSDFVNQLNDEHSLELNLEYESENISHQIPPKTAAGSLTSSSNFQSNCDKEQPVANNFISLIPSVASVESPCANPCASPESACPVSVEDDDLNSEENDYISKAVMLSMQEDDFSILNCDQSPFQGTISVVDENSQLECDKLKELEEDMTLASEDNATDVQVSFAHSSASEDDLMDQEHVFYCGGNGMNEKLIKENTYRVQERDTSKQNAIIYPSLPSQLQEAEHLAPDNMQQEVFCVSAFNRDEATNVQDVQHISSSMDVVSSDVPPSPVGGCSVAQANFDLSASLNGNVIFDGGNVYQISSLGAISLVENHNLFQISSSDDVSALVTSQDVFFSTSHSDVGELSCLPTACFTGGKLVGDPQNVIISGSCSQTQNVEKTSNVFFLPCSSEGGGRQGSDIVTYLGSSNLILNSNIPSIPDSSMEFCPLDSRFGSLPEVTIANADSTTVLLPSSQIDGSTARLVAMTTPNTNAFRTSPFLEAHMIDGKADVSISNLSLDSGSTDNLFMYNAIDEIGSSTSPLNCESSKENGFTSYDLQLVESVLSEQNDGPSIPHKLSKKTVTCLTEKGSNTSKSNSGDDNQSIYRRSSGDRYFPYFKEKVVEYATKHTAKEAARYFGVNVDTVTIWTRGKIENDSVVRNYPDQLMLRWLKRNRESGIILTKDQIVEKALQLLKTPGSWVKDKSRWFHVWASRLADEEGKKKGSLNHAKELTPVSVDSGDKKALYPDDFKVEVVLYAEQTSKNLASTIFNIARKRVFEWSAAVKVSKEAQEENPTAVAGLNQSSQSAGTNDQMNNAHKAPTTVKLKLHSKGVGRAVTNVAVDQELWEWFCEQTAKKSKPKSKDIRAKAVELFRAHNHDKIQCSHGWLKKWSMRFGITLRHEGDGDLLAWCLEQFDRNRNISHRDLLNHAQEFLTGTHKSEFKASAGWLVRFCKRHRNLLSAKPGVEVEIPNPLKHLVAQFRSNTLGMIHSTNTPLSRVGCMDEVPLNFTSGGSHSRLLLRRSGLENCHATVILSCQADGELLPPAVIFKGEGPTETFTYGDASLIVFYQQDCCMTASIMQQWLELVWIRMVRSPSILLADCYDPHCSDLIQETCDAANISLSIIPAGCSFKLQPLDLAISRLFEGNIYNRWTRHFSTSDQLSACKRTSYSSNTDIGRWIMEAYSTLKETRKEAIRRSFLVTGLTSALNGVEDHLIEDPTYVPFTSIFTSQT